MRLFKVLKRHSPRGILFLAILFGVLSGAGSSTLLAIINSYLSSLPNVENERLYMWGFIFIVPMVAIVRFTGSFVLVRLGARASYDLQVSLTQRILGAPLRRLEEVGSHRLLVALTEDTGSVSQALTALPVLFINSTVVFGCVLYLGWLDWRVMIVFLGFLVVGVLLYQLPMLAGIKLQALTRESEDKLFEHFRSITQGTKELKIDRRRTSRFLELLKAAAGTFRDLQVASMRIFIAAANIGNLMFFTFIAFLLFYLPKVFPGLGVEVLFGYVLVLLYIFGPLQMVLDEFPTLTQADVAVRKVESLGISLTEEVQEDDEGESSAPWSELQIRSLEHTYHTDSEDREFSIGPLDLTFSAGEIIFVVGGNGSGKTTFVKLLLGLYTAEKGKIGFDGDWVDDTNRLTYRQRFSVVFSDFFLFEELLGLESPDLDDKAREYVEMLELSHKVRVQDGRFSTIDLSQGQRKRLGLLTAFLEDKPVLVFDEWAADQDPDFKRVFYQELLPSLKKRNKLVIVISHDDHYYHVADRIVKLDYGQLEYDLPLAETPFATEAK
jgi:putative ATP-binding cassette transporter